MWSFSSFWPPDLIVSPSSFLCCCHPQFVAHQLKERGNISPPPPPPTTATTNHHHQPSLLFCGAAGFCWTITQRDLYWYWFALWWDVFQPLRAERGEYKRSVRRMNCCRLVFGASGDALIGVCGPCASPLDRDISWKHFPQPSLSLWSLFFVVVVYFSHSPPSVDVWLVWRRTGSPWGTRCGDIILEFCLLPWKWTCAGRSSWSPSTGTQQTPSKCRSETPPDAVVVVVILIIIMIIIK